MDTDLHHSEMELDTLGNQSDDAFLLNWKDKYVDNSCVAKLL